MSSNEIPKNKPYEYDKEAVAKAIKALRESEIEELKELRYQIAMDQNIKKEDLIDLIDMCIETDNISQSIKDFYEDRL